MKDMKQELIRVNQAIEDAKKICADLKQSLVMTQEKYIKINELQTAIKIGSIYRDKIKAKC